MKKILPLLCSCIIALTACQKEMPKSGASLEQILSAYDQGEVFSSATLDGNTLTVTFSSGKTLNIDVKQIKIEDCHENSQNKVSVNGRNEFLINGFACGITKEPNLSNAESELVYGYFTYETLCLYLSNGNIISFPSSNIMPRITITTDGNAPIVSKDVYVNGVLSVEDPSGLFVDMDGFKSGMKIRGRGNSTWGMPKKPYKIKLDEKATMFGMPKDKEWCLLANYSDKSLLRNITAMHISSICNMSWTPRMVSVELYINNEYCGVYTFSEHKKVSSNRVNIDVAAGDVYLEIDENQDELVCWRTLRYKVPMMFSDPEDPDSETKNNIINLLDKFEGALAGSAFDTPNGYAAYIDVNSFVNYYIIQELVKNIDGDVRRSSFLTKTVNGKFEMYHVWDFDLTMGNCDYFESAVGNGMDNGFTGWYIRDFSGTRPNTGWYHRLFQDPNFEELVKGRWKELYPQLLQVPDFIREHYCHCSEPAKRNFERWKILGEYVWPNVVIPGTYSGEIDYLIDFYQKRLNWMNNYLGK